MFNNLIESSSHKREFKRRGSFFLFTVAAYALLFVVGGVVSIYAYDAQLDEQTEQIITMLNPVDLPSAPKPVNEVTHPNKPARGEDTVDERRNAVVNINHPDIVPEAISTKPNPDLPMRDGHPTFITGRDRNGESGSPLNSGPPSTSVSGPTTVQITEPPPPVPVVPKPVPQIIKKNVINGEAVELPKPPYPQLAKINRIQGTVSVQVLIDETGKVISARAVSGSGFLSADAVRAAYRARFSPTKIGDQPVKVSGLINYNFVLE